MREIVDVAIVGAGFSGLGMAIALKRARPASRFVVLEKAERLGGVWRDNQYPGAACDVPARLYSFSFAQKPDWSRRYAGRAEIAAYLAQCVALFDLAPHLRFNAGVAGARWDEPARLWVVTLASGEELPARALISAMGPLSEPAFPNIDGMETFAGPMFHSARWRDDVSLNGKRVALIGAGASAAQIIPEIAPRVAQLDVYMRRPPWVLPKHDRGSAPWAAPVFRAAPWLRDLHRRALYAWLETRALAFLAPSAGKIAAAVARAHLARQIPDPALRATLAPPDVIGCRRVVLSDDFYPALARENVSVIRAPIERFDAQSVVTPEGARPADVVILATGFRPLDILAHLDIRGANGRSLRADWAAGPEAHLGVMVAGYPNFFLLAGPNTGLGHNSLIYMIESQIAFVLDALNELDRRGAAALEPQASVQAAFNADLQARFARTAWADCRSWYRGADGRNRALWPSFSFRYRARAKRLHAADYAFESADTI